MGRLIIDGNSVFEIDEECLKNKKIPKDCDLKKYFRDDKKYAFVKTESSDRNTTKKKHDF